ncbi:unnamed protein product [Caenorhabditis auriculariae]|uniref:Sodium/potassium-transporting ATPase subunit beta-1-interacting protein n=1 Tax=Caenorhabditis auriculariae TaxID=2777116 RepID=A0A8S1HN75_9PELO|nr:unnamed protein product [Caenorhabditis auriculariae]
MNRRSWLSLLLGTWLGLSVARLAFDLVGKLWLPVAFDLLQVICCITGLFGSLQKRSCLLIGLAVSNVLSTVENVLIFLWYVGIFGDITRPILSAGLPYSFSFFLRFTPNCESHFDLKRSIWVQGKCLIPFYVIEAAQAVLHILFATVTTILAVMTVLEWRKKSQRPASSSFQSMSSQPQYAQITPSKVGHPPSSINDGSSGYMNSTYEELGRTQAQKVANEATRIQYERNSKRKRGKIRPNSMPAPDVKPCSSTPADDAHLVEDVYTKPVKSTRILRNQDDEIEHIEIDEEVIRGPTTVTSLVSFDPKSATLLRIREHLESEDDKEVYEDRIYEKIRSRSAAEVPNGGYRSRNGSQDSVPTMLAPILTSPQTSSADSGMLSSSGEWPLHSAPPPARAKSLAINYQFKQQPQLQKNLSPGIKLLMEPERGLGSPGIKLADTGPQPKYKSAFRLQTKSDRVIGHYHSPKEIPLSSKPLAIQNDFPVIKGEGLLV